MKTGLSRAAPAESGRFWSEAARAAPFPEEVREALEAISAYAGTIAESAGLDDFEALARLGSERRLRARELPGELGAAAEIADGRIVCSSNGRIDWLDPGLLH